MADLDKGTLEDYHNPGTPSHKRALSAEPDPGDKRFASNRLTLGSIPLIIEMPPPPTMSAQGEFEPSLSVVVAPTQSGHSQFVRVQLYRLVSLDSSQVMGYVTHM